MWAASYVELIGGSQAELLARILQNATANTEAPSIASRPNPMTAVFEESAVSPPPVSTPPSGIVISPAAALVKAPVAFVTIANGSSTPVTE